MLPALFQELYFFLLTFLTLPFISSFCLRSVYYEVRIELKQTSIGEWHEYTDEPAQKTLTLYPQRRYLVLQLLANVILSVIIASFWVWSIFTSWPLFWKTFNSPFNEFIGIMPLALMAGAVLLLVYLLLSFLLYIYCLDIYVLMQHYLSYQPILRIDEQGIAINKLPIIKSVFLSWPEVAALRIARDPLNGRFCLYVYPKDMHHLLSSLNRLQRFGWYLLRFWSSSFAFPLESADSAIETRIQEAFSGMLQEHQIPIYTR